MGNRNPHLNISRMTRADSPMYLSTTPLATTCAAPGAHDARPVGCRLKDWPSTQACLPMRTRQTQEHGSAQAARPHQLRPQARGAESPTVAQPCLEEVGLDVGGNGLGQQRLACREVGAGKRGVDTRASSSSRPGVCTGHARSPCSFHANDLGHNVAISPRSPHRCTPPNLCREGRTAARP